MKIVIIQGAFLPVPALQGGAVEKIWYRMGQEFAALGHDVVHIGRTYYKLQNLEEVNGVKYIRIKGYDTPSSLIKLKLLDLLYSIRAIKQIPKDAEVIVTNTFWSPLLLRGKISKKVYVSVERFPRGQMKWYSHVGILRGCSPIICAAIRKEIGANLYNHISYVPNPVPFDVRQIKIKREKTILFVGRLHPEKGVHILLDAFMILNREFNDWRLILVGPSDVKNGGGGNEYLKKLKALVTNSNVELVGAVFDENVLINYYAQASIFCYPAQEGSGDAAPVAPREAMAYGCVPVVSQLECFNDFIINGENGITYPQNAKNQAFELSKVLSMLIKNPIALNKMSFRGKEVSHKYSSQAVAKQFLKDFEKLVN